ncbi:hypothetical protein [Idiomarina loihiensis]|uniref:hypothetical protein n=1 Tax=Idiomarina loihiensis TaxID=135577 RepID=UPI00384FFF34
MIKNNKMIFREKDVENQLTMREASVTQVTKDQSVSGHGTFRNGAGSTSIETTYHYVIQCDDGLRRSLKSNNPSVNINEGDKLAFVEMDYPDENGHTDVLSYRDLTTGSYSAVTSMRELPMLFNLICAGAVFIWGAGILMYVYTRYKTRGSKAGFDAVERLHRQAGFRAIKTKKGLYTFVPAR